MQLYSDKLTFKHIWPLNNVGLHCEGPLIRGFFAIINTTVLQSLQLVETENTEEPQILRAHDKLYVDF